MNLTARAPRKRRRRRMTEEQLQRKREKARVRFQNLPEEKKDALRTHSREWYRNAPEEVKQVQRDRAAKRWKESKKAVFDHYGRVCVCCGETDELFLTIDHIDNDGNKQRKASGTNSQYSLILRDGFPSNLRTLCYNCNCGRAKNGGICSHPTKLLVNASVLQSI